MVGQDSLNTPRIYRYQVRSINGGSLRILFESLNIVHMLHPIQYPCASESVLDTHKIMEHEIINYSEYRVDSIVSIRKNPFFY